MADSRYPLLGIFVVFAAFVAKDLFWNQQEKITSDTNVKEIPDVKFNRFVGPTLKFAFWYVILLCYRKVYEQYAAILHEKYPDLLLEGENYPPPAFRQHFAQLLGIGKLLLIACVLGGMNPFQWFGANTPDFWNWATQNKLYACMMTFFLSNFLESQLLSTGAFEITFNDVPMWSKLQTGRVPQPPELFQMLDSQLQMSKMPSVEIVVTVHAGWC
nr:EOG090X0DP2 [Triops cancriformis]